MAWPGRRRASIGQDLVGVRCLRHQMHPSARRRGAQKRSTTGVTGRSSVEPQLWQRAMTVWRRTGKVCTPQRWHSHRVARSVAGSTGSGAGVSPTEEHGEEFTSLATLTNIRLAAVFQLWQVLHNLAGQSCSYLGGSVVGEPSYGS